LAEFTIDQLVHDDVDLSTSIPIEMSSPAGWVSRSEH
jgi:hypothetical protein